MTSHPSKQILIIEDNELNQYIATNLLHNHGYQTLVAHNGLEGIKLAKQNPPDLILLDILMPGLNGFETCEQLKQDPNTKDIPVIFMTAVSHIDDKVKGFEVGAVDYILKPFQREEFLARINTHLRLDELNKRLEQRVAERTAALEKAKELADAANHAKNMFLANTSHELRTPLNAILGYSELATDMIDKGESVGQIRADIQKIDRAGRILLNIIDNLLNISRVDMGIIELYVEKVHVQYLVWEVEQTSMILFKDKGLDFVVDPVLANVILYTDVMLCQRILINLLDNAAKFTETGQVTVRVIPDVTLNGREAVRFEVQDTGSGIEAEKLDIIFKIFEQADNSYTRKHQGVGLGLSLVYRLVSLLHGEIEVKSEVGVGSLFAFTLPVQIP